jgi:hypothetical protein
LLTHEFHHMRHTHLIDDGVGRCGQCVV